MRSDTMAQHPTEFTQQTTERAMLAASVGMNLFRQIAEQNIKQSRQPVEELGKVTRRMVDDFGNQASAICENSLSLAEEATSNTFDCVFKMLRVREPQELVQVQTGFVSRQAQLIADRTEELNEKWMRARNTWQTRSRNQLERNLRPRKDRTAFFDATYRCRAPSSAAAATRGDSRAQSVPVDMCPTASASCRRPLARRPKSTSTVMLTAGHGLKTPARFASLLDRRGLAHEREERIAAGKMCARAIFLAA
jgi:hypothetical protein